MKPCSDDNAILARFPISQWVAAGSRSVSGSGERTRPTNAAHKTMEKIIVQRDGRKPIMNTKRTYGRPAKKRLATIIREAQETHEDDEFSFYADAERRGEISRETYFRACKAGDASRAEAAEWLRENYQRAGVEHLY